MRSRQKFWITRLLGKLFLASGFFLSIYGLAQSSRILVNMSLALLAAGIGLMAVSFYDTLRSRGSDKGLPKTNMK